MSVGGFSRDLRRTNFHLSCFTGSQSESRSSKAKKRFKTGFRTAQFHCVGLAKFRSKVHRAI
jgi:hypothetical protein